MTISAFELEQYLIPLDQWDTCGAPDKALQLAKEGVEDGYPSGLAHHPTLGWFVLECGQGPYILWSEQSKRG